MSHYIDKDALVAEIEKQRQLIFPKNTGEMKVADVPKPLEQGWLNALSWMKKTIDSIEVKEVDLKKEYEEFVVNDPVYNKLVNGIVGKAIAKHFYELGIKAQRKSISIQNVDDVLKESGVDPDSKVAKMFKESYYAAIDKLLEQKRK